MSAADDHDPPAAPLPFTTGDAEASGPEPVIVPPAGPPAQLDIKPEFIGGDPGPLPLPLPSAAEPTPEGLPADPGDPFLGKTFGGYVLEKKVGQGGMGLVYKGRQARLDRIAAIKILNKALNENQEFIKRFEREAKSIAKINHPHIVGVYDFGHEDGAWFMVCEFIEGQSLAKMITDQLMLPVATLAPLMVQCLDALAHVGGQGVVHRDIKPDNILITRDGQSKIADFGLAKDVTNTNDHTDLTAVGMAMGTPAYMSPEQCMGRKLDGRSDLYSLGVTAYYALTGEKPFTGQSSFEIMTRQREHTPPPPAKLNPSIPRECSDLVMRMLAKNPVDRFADAAICKHAWQNVIEHLRGPPPVARPAADPVRVSSAELPPPPVLQPPVLPPPPGAGSVRAVTEERRPITEARISQRRSNATPAPSSEDSTVSEGRSAGDRAARPATDRRPRSIDGGFATCSRCGTLNRAETPVCSKCGTPLRAGEDDPRLTEAEAQRLMDEARFRDAALVFARLADREHDKRNRTILRSREREARKLDAHAQVEGVRAKARSLVDRGDLRGAIAMLEAGRSPAPADSGATTISMDGALVADISEIRQRLARRSKMLWIIALIAVLAVGVGAYAVWRQLTAAQPAAEGAAHGR
jgi:serine/threonine protein kinase